MKKKLLVDLSSFRESVQGFLNSIPAGILKSSLKEFLDEVEFYINRIYSSFVREMTTLKKYYVTSGREFSPAVKKYHFRKVQKDLKNHLGVFWDIHESTLYA